MLIVPMRPDLIDDVAQLMRLGAPYVVVRGASDYWLYGALFASTCPVAVDGGEVVGAVIAMRSQDDPDDVYVQDAMVHPARRRRGVATMLLGAVTDQARRWGCRRVYLTSAPGNAAAAATWRRLGFRNLPGDLIVSDVKVVADFKGAGRDRAVYQLDLATAAPAAPPTTEDQGEGR
jgi:ribosomal protein S18 acetylase RimI-like enzyme